MRDRGMAKQKKNNTRRERTARTGKQELEWLVVVVVVEGGNEKNSLPSKIQLITTASVEPVCVS
jgi:hypothetical protein